MRCAPANEVDRGPLLLPLILTPHRGPGSTHFSARSLYGATTRDRWRPHMAYATRGS